MARQRTISPEFFSDEDLGALEPLARLFFIGLWTQADRRGRVEDRPAKLRAKLLPYDHTADGEAMMVTLERSRFVIRYTSSSGSKLLQIRNFEKFQHPHPKEVESVLPGPGRGETVESRGKTRPSRAEDSASKPIPSFPSGTSENEQQTSAPPAAVAAPSLSICKPSTSKAVAPVVRARANSTDPWPTSEAVDLYRRRFGAGSGHPKAIIGAIDPLVRGQARARASPASAAWRDAVGPAFKRYLGLGPGPGTTHPKPNAADFVDMFADWLPGAKGSNGKPSVVELYQGGLELLEERRGREGGGEALDPDGDARARIETSGPGRERDQVPRVGTDAPRRLGAGGH